MANLYKIDRPDEADYDNYISAIICANSENEAKNTHPSGYNENFNSEWNEWIEPKTVIVTLIGTADNSINLGVVLSSYKHG